MPFSARAATRGVTKIGDNNPSRVARTGRALFPESARAATRGVIKIGDNSLCRVARTGRALFPESARAATRGVTKIGDDNPSRVARTGRALFPESAKFGFAACLAGVVFVGTLFALELPPFREYPGVEYQLGEIKLPPDYQEKTEWTFARLMYPQASGVRSGRGFGIRGGGFGGRGGGGIWTEGNSIWTQDYPRADRHFAEALRRLTRIHGRSVEQPVNLDDGAVYDWPWLYAVQAGQWQLTGSQIRTLREYLLRGGFFMADDFWGQDQWEVFMDTMRKVLPGREPVELGNDDPIFHVVYDLGERYQVASEGSAQRGVSWKCQNCPDHWLGIRDDNGRVMVAITFQSDIGDSWEWADAPYYPEVYSRLGIRIGVNYIAYAMTH